MVLVTILSAAGCASDQFARRENVSPAHAIEIPPHCDVDFFRQHISEFVLWIRLTPSGDAHEETRYQHEPFELRLVTLFVPRLYHIGNPITVRGGRPLNAWSRISVPEAQRLLEELVRLGFFENAQGEEPPREYPSAALRVATWIDNEQHVCWMSLPWDEELHARLLPLQRALEPEAAAVLERLIGPLAEAGP